MAIVYLIDKIKNFIYVLQITSINNIPVNLKVES